MPTASTAAPASQFPTARTITIVQPARESCSSPSRPAQTRMTWPGSATGRRASRDPPRRAH
ncbi:MAG: hypothetical protein WBF34_39145, partial [Streptosporangiaceae bacterium]